MNDSLLDPKIVSRLQVLLLAAANAGDPEPTAMSLATSDGGGRVSVRIVLLKGVDGRGLRFFTNGDSRKGRQLAANPEVALAFHWKTLDDGVQVRVEGRVETLPEAESDAYFASRPRLSQIGAWASLQSQRLPDRSTFEARLGEFDLKFSGGNVPRPPHWGGYLVRPRMVEFWHARANRLHERECWMRDAHGAWSTRLLYP
ncbi:MAG TPA: pyridoxamine 5'-phosphate oxidase [Rhodanobacteraceae bacterium]|nr:pyridoxamine 5'-phosphate oxidase [Rhodanobacteraceae bacterium]